MDNRLRFRWLGVAGVELTYRGQTLAIDPFFTRPPLWSALGGRPQSNIALASEKLPRCHHLLVSHPHYDHLMDVPAIARHTGAAVYGSDNTCRIACLLGLPQELVHEIFEGDRLLLGDFEVEVLNTEHVWTPVDCWINGPLPADLRPPLRLRDYRMDRCFAFRIQVGGFRFLFNKQPLPADVWAFAPLRNVEAYAGLLHAVQPRLVIPIHWDNFFRSLEKSLRPLPQPPKFLWPGLNNQRPQELKRRIEGCFPGVNVHIPRPFEPVILDEFLGKPP